MRGTPETVRSPQRRPAAQADLRQLLVVTATEAVDRIRHRDDTRRQDATGFLPTSGIET